MLILLAQLDTRYLQNTVAFVDDSEIATMFIPCLMVKENIDNTASICICAGRVADRWEVVFMAGRVK
jgi:hypothetical protein